MKNKKVFKSVFIVVVVGIFVACSKPSQEKTAISLPLKEAEDALNGGNILMARQLYIQARDSVEDISKLEMIQNKIEELNLKIIFSPVIDEYSAKYVVKPSDALSKIAKNFATTVELIKRSNNLSSDIIRPGQELKIVNCKFSMAVDKSQNRLFLKRGDEIIKTYVVSTGKDNSTPVGDFKIVNKLANPTWFKTGAVIPPDSSQNILGTRWLGFNIQGYGIHGTTEPDQLGQQVTMGCVRMKNEEVEELYDIVPVGAEVTVVD